LQIKLLTLLDLVAFEQGIDGWLLSAESLVEGHRMFGASLRKDIVAEALGGSLVEDAVLLEYAEGIKRVVYAEKYRLTDGVDLLKRAGVVVEYMNPDEEEASQD
jgi:hypothetical protein